MPHQEALTVMTKIQSGKMDALKTLLGTISEDVKDNRIIPFKEFTHVHFARFVILDEETDLTGQMIQPSLVFTSNVDAPLTAHLDELVNKFGPGIDQIFSHCEDYPAPNQRIPENRLTFLRSHRLDYQAFYVNTVGRSVQQVCQEAYLRETIEEFLDRERHNSDWSDQSPAQIRALIQNFVESQADLSWAKTPPSPPELGWRVRQFLAKVGIPLGLLLIAPLVLLVLPIWLVLLRIHENRDIPENIRTDQKRVRKLREAEDFVVQNQFSAVGFIKPGWFRRITVRVILFLVNYGIRHLYNRGRLTGVTTIHFARWVPIDEGRRLLFCSNYDGSLESYMDDFIDKVAWGLNAVFSNGVGYPRTRWLIKGGAQDEQAFKSFLENHQLQTQVWYAAYDRLTAINIENNAEIRKGLYGSLSEQATEAWLHRF